MKRKLILVLLLICSFTFSQQVGIAKFVKNVIGYKSPYFPPPAAFSYNELRFNFFDIYRKRTNSINSLSIYESQSYFSLNLPSIKNKKVKFKLDLIHENLKFNNERDLTSIVTNYPISFNSSKLEILLPFERNIIQTEIGYGLSSSKGIFYINNYPRSDDELVNKFFYNWLKPTFGSELKTSINLSNFNVSSIFENKTCAFNPGISISKTIINNNIEVNYINTSNKPELTGRRSLSIPIDINSTLLSIFIKPFLKENMLNLSVFDDKIIFNTDNHPPAFTDFESLGYFEFYRRGISVSSVYRVNNLIAEVGLSSYKYGAKLNMHTPVMGYYSKIFPVSHGVIGKISGGESYFSHLLIQNEYKISFLDNTFKILYFHGYITAPIKGDAELEFGLLSTPIDTNLKYKIQILEFNYNISVTFGITEINFSFSKFVPIIRRVDKSKISLRKEFLNRKISHSGGDLYSVFIFFPIN